MTTEHARELREIITQALAKSKSPDPHEIARRLIARMSPQERDAALASSLGESVRVEIGRIRMRVSDPRESAQPGPSRWAQIRERVCVDGDWKFIDQCGVDDLLVIAASYDTQAAQSAAKAGQFRAMADELRASGCATVGELRERVAA